MMNRLLYWLCIIIFLSGLIGVFTGPVTGCLAASESEQPEQVAKRLEESYRQITSLSFSFFQKTSGQLAGRPKEGKGNGVFVKTESGTMMRWNYLAPEHQVVISDGEYVSMYFEKLNQMIISPVESAQTDVLFSFFTGNMPLSKNFEILPPEEQFTGQPEKSPDGLQVIQLRPLAQQSQINTIHLWISDESLIRRIELLDHFDTRTIINLSNLQTNTVDVMDQDVLSTLFTFTPPEGTEIIRQ
jgi:outer membrane lipoprotein carrier protein